MNNFNSYELEILCQNRDTKKKKKKKIYIYIYIYTYIDNQCLESTRVI